MSIATAEIRLDKRVTSFVKERRKLLIDGQWVDAASGKTFPVENPATGEVIARLLATSPCSSLAKTCSEASASRSSLHRHPTSSPRTHPQRFSCARYLGPSLNLRRQAVLRSWQLHVNASVSVRGDAKEEGL